MQVECLDLASELEMRGGSATVSLVRHLGSTWAFKTYHAEDRTQLDFTQLERLIAFRLSLTEVDREYLDSRTAWPRSIVRDDSGGLGVLLPLAPPQFLEQVEPYRLKPRHLARLTRPRDDTHAYYGLRDKLIALGHLGELMLFLHAHDVVIADLQPNNVLVTAPRSEPGVLLLDCDSVVLAGAAALPQVDPVLYKLPAARAFDVKSDFFKFALLTARCIEEDNSVFDCRDARARSVMHGNSEMLRRALRDEFDDGDDELWRGLFRRWQGRTLRRSVLSRRVVIPAVVIAAVAALSGLILWRGEDPAPRDPSPIEEPLILENFEAAGDVPMEVVGSGRWQVAGGRLVLVQPDTSSDTGNKNIALHSTEVDGDFAVSVRARVSPTAARWDDFSVILGYRSIDEYYFVSLNENNDDRTSGIFRVVKGSITQLADITQPITSGVDYLVRVERSGTTVRVFLDGVAVTSTTISDTIAGSMGIGTRNGAASFDDFQVSTLP